MGKLTDSLREAAKELDNIESGIDRIANIGQELAENTVNVADAALRAGYSYAKVEAQEQEEIASLTVSKALPDASEIQKEFVSLRSSQNSLKSWNDIYRIQKVLVVEYLKKQNVDDLVIDQVENIFKLKSVRQAPKFGSNLLNLEASEIVRLLKKVTTYTSHLLQK
ncbi:MAG: hypothetical protein WBB29_13160 [Geitlerinemataceae cyanobacterium]